MAADLCENTIPRLRGAVWASMRQPEVLDTKYLESRAISPGVTWHRDLPVSGAYAAAREWHAIEFIDHGVSGAKERRAALDRLVTAVRTRRVDVVACVKLDRLARSVRHLVGLAQEFEALGVHLVALDQALDTTTPSSRLLFHVLGAIAEFERDLIRDRVRAWMWRA